MHKGSTVTEPLQRFRPFAFFPVEKARSHPPEFSYSASPPDGPLVKASLSRGQLIQPPAKRVTMGNIHWSDHIEERVDILSGKPAFKRTRIPVDLVFTELGNGTTQEELLANYPAPKTEHLRAAMLFAAAVIRMAG